MRQYPSSFEFNEEFLIFLFEHAYASEFGSFLGNCEADKAKYNVKNNTVSLWSYVNHPEVLSTFVSACYQPYISVLWPSVAPQSIVIYFLNVSKLSSYFSHYGSVCICAGNKIGLILMKLNVN